MMKARNLSRNFKGRRSSENIGWTVKRGANFGRGMLMNDQVRYMTPGNAVMFVSSDADGTEHEMIRWKPGYRGHRSLVKG